MVPSLLKVIKEISVQDGKGTHSCLHLKALNIWALPRSGGHDLYWAMPGQEVVLWEIQRFGDFWTFWDHNGIWPYTQASSTIFSPIMHPVLLPSSWWLMTELKFWVCSIFASMRLNFETAAHCSAGEETLPFKAHAQISCSLVFLHKKRVYT